MRILRLISGLSIYALLLVSCTDSAEAECTDVTCYDYGCIEHPCELSEI